MTFQVDKQQTGSKAEMYSNLASQLRSLVEGERDFIANAVGPFQGKPACVRIAMGKGVCGAAAKQRQTILVDNVHEFPGHIACDSESNSEIVVPLMKDQQLIGVLDLDSPKFGRFDDADARGLNELAEIFVNSTKCSA